MADSDALRSRRKRAHAAGDHSLCRACDARRTVVPLPVADGTGFDPLAALVALARRLEAAHEADPANANVARELRISLQALAGDSAGPPPADEVDLIRSEWEGTRGA
jgi:hypothetical protein